MAIRDRQRAAHDLMHADEQLGRVRGGQHLVDHAVDRLVAKRVDGLETLLLLAQSRPQRMGGVRVIEDVAARLDLDLELGNGERPRAQGLGQSAFEIEEPQQAPRVLLDGELSAHGPRGRAGTGREKPAGAPPPPGGSRETTRRHNASWVQDWMRNYRCSTWDRPPTKRILQRASPMASTPPVSPV